MWWMYKHTWTTIPSKVRPAHASDLSGTSYTQTPTKLVTACYSCGQEESKVDRIFVSLCRCCLLCVQWDSWCVQWQGWETHEVPRCSNTVYWVSWNDYKISAIVQALPHQTLSTVPSESICSSRYWWVSCMSKPSYYDGMLWMRSLDSMLRSFNIYIYLLTEDLFGYIPGISS